jgi:hypothetical protein
MDSKDISFLCQLLSTLLRTRVEQTKMDQIQLKELDNSFIEFENQEEKLLQSREVPELNFEIWERERGNSNGKYVQKFFKFYNTETIEANLFQIEKGKEYVQIIRTDLPPLEVDLQNFTYLYDFRDVGEITRLLKDKDLSTKLSLVPGPLY